MKLIRTHIPEILIIQPPVVTTGQGYTIELFSALNFSGFIGDTTFMLDTIQYYKFGVLTGPAYQKPPYTQLQLVSVLKGMVLQVAVDIRIGAPTYGQYVSVILTGQDHYQLLVPKGFALGYIVLSKSAFIMIKSDNIGSNIGKRGFCWNDPWVNINWRVPEKYIVLAEADKHYPFLLDVNDFYYKDFL
ncbi:dTDP-4-dehydrorhamnose 3,5-epimerase family protein [Gaoshiqia sp. Z1-71]|uniref:dTDP-4-dehydrorhamnose 3,5-epimerase family protein n=1 Tax=Gaoshiqia hydrogeniformans TaxID=3290090 RepID=UPI003BF8A490